MTAAPAPLPLTRGRQVDYQRVPTLLFWALALFFLGTLASRTEADPDLWGHVRFGQEILGTWSVPRADPYSFTSDKAWINHEWLSEAVTAAVYGAAGTPGLVALGTAVAAFVMAVTWVASKRRAVRTPVAAGLVIVAFMGVSAQLATPRPQIFSVALFTILLAVISAARQGRFRWLAAVPAVFAVWANLHGGWIVGLAVLWLWAIGSTRRVPAGWLLFAGIAGTLATLASPYGVGLWRFLWQTVGVARPGIEDWQPLFYFPRRLIAWGVTTFVAVSAWRRRDRSASVLLFLPVLMLGALSLKVVRLDAFYALTVVLLLGDRFAGVGPERFPLTKAPSAAELVVIFTLVAGALAGILYQAGRTAVCLPLMQRAVAEPEALLFIRDNDLSGRFLMWFDYGEYAIWHLWPRVQVSFDGRRETVYSERVQQRHLAFYFGEDTSYVRELRADAVWLPAPLPIVQALEREGWVAAFRGSRSAILVRDARPYRRPAPFSGPRCFPGP